MGLIYRVIAILYFGVLSIVITPSKAGHLSPVPTISQIPTVSSYPSSRPSTSQNPSRTPSLGPSYTPSLDPTRSHSPLTPQPSTSQSPSRKPSLDPSYTPSLDPTRSHSTTPTTQESQSPSLQNKNDTIERKSPPSLQPSITSHSPSLELNHSHSILPTAPKSTAPTTRESQFPSLQQSNDTIQNNPSPSLQPSTTSHIPSLDPNHSHSTIPIVQDSQSPYSQQSDNTIRKNEPSSLQPSTSQEPSRRYLIEDRSNPKAGASSPKTREESQAPSLRPSFETIEVSTAMDGNFESYGNMFDVRSLHRNITIHTLSFLTVTKNTNETFRVYTKSGSYVGAEMNISQWTRVASGATAGRGEYEFTRIPFESFTPVTVVAGSTRAFYVTLTAPHIIYKEGFTDDFVVGRNEDLEIVTGMGVISFPSDNQFVAPRSWRGSIHYSVPPTEMPTLAPTSSVAPTATPSGKPTFFEMMTTLVVFRFKVDAPLSATALADVDKGIFGALNEYFSKEINVLTSLGFSNKLHIISVNSINDDEKSTITSTVSINHLNSISSDDVTFALRYYSEQIAEVIGIESAGPKPIYTGQIITLKGSGFDSATMGASQTSTFANATKQFLKKTITSNSNGMNIFSVIITDQGNTASARQNRQRNRLHMFQQIFSANNLRYVSDNINSDGDISSIEISVAITGEYNPPPFVELGEVVDESLNENGHEFIEELQKTPGFENISAFDFRPSPFPVIENSPIDQQRRQPEATEQKPFQYTTTILAFIGVFVSVMAVVMVGCFFNNRRRKKQERNVESRRQIFQRGNELYDDMQNTGDFSIPLKTDFKFSPYQSLRSIL